MKSTKKLPTWGRGVSKNPKSCQHCLWMVPNGTWILPECNKEGLFWYTYTLICIYIYCQNDIGYCAKENYTRDLGSALCYDNLS